jgi:hypothetical protein
MNKSENRRKGNAKSLEFYTYFVTIVHIKRCCVYCRLMAALFLSVVVRAIGLGREVGNWGLRKMETKERKT